MTQQWIDEINTLPAEAQRQLTDFAEFLRQKHTVTPSMQPRRATELKDEPFIGMWRDREDLEDSSQVVRESRKSEWGEKQSVHVDDV